MAIDRKAFTKTKFQNIKIHKDGIKFWLNFKIAGKQYSKIWNSNPVHTRVDRIRQAQNQLEVFRNEITRKENIEANTEGTVDDYWNMLVEDKKRKWSDAQMSKNKSYYNTYIKKMFGSKMIKDVKPAMFTAFNRTINHLATRTQKMAYELLMPIFNLAIEDEIIYSSPIKKNHVPKRKAIEEKKSITRAEEKYRAVYKAINKVYADDPHNRAIFLFGFHGRRRNEVLTLQWEDINFDNDSYIIRKKVSKVNADMTFRLPDDVRNALLEFRDTSGNIFKVNSIVHLYKNIRNEPNVPKEFTFHWMRNLSVSALSAMGVEVTHLSAMLGHTDSGTIRKYLSLQREASTTVTNEASKRLLS